MSPSDGPVLTQTDLYLLKPELEIHPILQQKYANFHLLLNISTGMHHQTLTSTLPQKKKIPASFTASAYSAIRGIRLRGKKLTSEAFFFFEGQSQDETGNDFREKEEPAVLPRVDQLYIISEFSPWCTTVKNEKGVTLTDVCSAVWQEYVIIFLT